MGSEAIPWDPMGPWAGDLARPTRENDDENENENENDENDENGNTVNPHSTRAQG